MINSTKPRFLKWLDQAIGLLVWFFPKRFQAHTDPKSILVVKLSAMGDALCLMPSLRIINKSYPNISIEWLTTNRTNPKLFSKLCFLNKIIVMPSTPLKAFVFLLKNVISFSRYDLIIDFDQYYKVSELIALLGQSSAGFKTPIKGSKYNFGLNYSETLNEKIHFLELASTVLPKCAFLKAEYSSTIYELGIDLVPTEKIKEIENRICSLNRKVVVLYPGSGPTAKIRRWANEKFIELARRCAKQYTVLIAGGNDEESLFPHFELNDKNIINLINKLSLDEWILIFRSLTTVFVGNDAGLLHVAESQGVPIVGIFGPNLGSKWGSIHQKSVIVDRAVSCRPCIKNYLGRIPEICSRGDVVCLTGISVETVFTSVQEIASKNHAKI